MERAKIADVMESKKFKQNEVIIKQVSYRKLRFL